MFHYGPQVSEGLHYSHKRALVITVHIQLQTHAALNQHAIITAPSPTCEITNLN